MWDRDGKPSAYSRPATWEMGLLSRDDWRGSWIGRTADTASAPAPLLRRDFRLRGRVRRARAYVSGLGYYELRINGRKVGDHHLDPGYTRYDRRVKITIKGKEGNKGLDNFGLSKADGGFNDGEDLWAKLVSKHPNFVMVVCGHTTVTGRRT